MEHFFGGDRIPTLPSPAAFVRVSIHALATLGPGRRAWRGLVGTKRSSDGQMGNGSEQACCAAFAFAFIDLEGARNLTPDICSLHSVQNASRGVCLTVYPSLCLTVDRPEPEATHFHLV